MKRTLSYSLLAVCLISLLGIHQTTAQQKNAPKLPKDVREEIHTRNPTAKTVFLKDFVTFNLVILTENDSIVRSTYFENKPIVKYMAEYSTPDKYTYRERGVLYDILRMMRIGDSATYHISSDLLFNEKIFMRRPDFIRPGSEVKYIIKVLKVQTEDEVNKEKELANYNQLQADNKLIGEYVSQNRLKPRKTSTGLWFVVDSAGTGKNPTPGDIVSVRFEGRFLDGTLFNSSDNYGGVLDFPVDENIAIPGFDQAVKILKEGGGGTFIVPSVLAYGKKGVSGLIPPDANLVFHIELLAIKEKVKIDTKEGDSENPNPNQDPDFDVKTGKTKDLQKNASEKENTELKVYDKDNKEKKETQADQYEKDYVKRMNTGKKKNR